MTHIITLFTLIVSRASKPLRGRLNHHVTMMGNQVMMTVIHTPSSYNFLWKPRFHPVWCAFSAWLFFIHLALHALLTSFSQFAIIDPTSFVMLPVGERIGHYYRE